MQAVLVSFQNNAVDKLVTCAVRILKITGTTGIEVYSVEENSQMTQNDFTDLYHLPSSYSSIVILPKLHEEAHRDKDASLDY